MTKRAPSPRTISALGWFVATLVLHAVLIPSQGLTDDDDFYAPAGIRYADWLTSPSTMFSRASIDAAFKPNHEHPPLAKLVFGLTHSIGFGLHDLDAARLGCALFAAILSAVLVLSLWQLGKAQALAAPLLLLSLPRFLFHSEVATLDVPVACAVFVVTATYFHAETAPIERRNRSAVIAGVAFGLALLVKLNAPFAIVPCALWSLLHRWRGFRVDAGTLVVPPIPRALPWMIVLGPILFVALWPWLWFDTFERIGAYIAFHLNHYAIYLFYDGEIWEKPFAPSSSVPVLAFAVLPITIAALGTIGAARALAATIRIARYADNDGDVPDVNAGDKLRSLLLLQAAFSMLVVMNPSTPRYGGEKLFMPFFPLWCALAADGAAFVATALTSIVASPRLRTPVVVGAVVALACWPGVLGSIHFRSGYALSYYGELVGGLRGAVARGYERTYYDVADKPLAQMFDERCRNKSTACRVHFEPNNKEYVRTYRWLKKDGVIGNNVSVVDDRAKADFIVLTHERRWSTYPALKRELEELPQVTEKSIDGVPLYTVYARR